MLLPQNMGNILCCVQVDQSTVAIKEQFGKFSDVLDPGCHCLPWCFGYQVAGHLSLRVQQLDVKCETKTKVRIFSIYVSCGTPVSFVMLIFFGLVKLKRLCFTFITRSCYWLMATPYSTKSHFCLMCIDALANILYKAQ